MPYIEGIPCNPAAERIRQDECLALTRAVERLRPKLLALTPAEVPESCCGRASYLISLVVDRGSLPRGIDAAVEADEQIVSHARNLSSSAKPPSR